MDVDKMASSGGSSPPKRSKLVENEPTGAAGFDDDEEREKLEETARQDRYLNEIDDIQIKLENLNEKGALTPMETELRQKYYEQRAVLTDKVTNFWSTVLFNTIQIRPLFDKREKDCIQYLKKLDVEELEHNNGFRVTFVFDENPYFDNQVLIKELRFGASTLPKNLSTKIRWKPNMDLSRKQEKVMDSRRRRMKPEIRTFFFWFSSNTNPYTDDISRVIRNELWPSPLIKYCLTESDFEDRKESDDGGER